MKISRQPDTVADEVDVQAYVASMDVNEKMASHPSHLEFLHKA